MFTNVYLLICEAFVCRAKGRLMHEGKFFPRHHGIVLTFAAEHQYSEEWAGEFLSPSEHHFSCSLIFPFPSLFSRYLGVSHGIRSLRALSDDKVSVSPAGWGPRRGAQRASVGGTGKGSWSWNHTVLLSVCHNNTCTAWLLSAYVLLLNKWMSKWKNSICLLLSLPNQAH